MPIMVTEYRGQLDWINCESAPFVINSLRIKENGKRILIDFCGDGEMGIDETAYKGRESASIQEEKAFLSSRKGYRIRDTFPSQPIYSTSMFAPYKKRIYVRIRILWKIKELRNSDGQPFCYVVAWWLNERGKSVPYECCGLLEGYTVEGQPWDQPNISLNDNEINDSDSNI